MDPRQGPKGPCTPDIQPTRRPGLDPGPSLVSNVCRVTDIRRLVLRLLCRECTATMTMRTFATVQVKVCFLSISIILTLASCSSEGLRRVENSNYSTDISCWGGKPNRYTGIGIIAGDQKYKALHIFSLNCTSDLSMGKYSALSDLGLVNISDPKNLLSAYLGQTFKTGPNFICDATPLPSESDRIYLIDIDTRAIDADGFAYLEVSRVNRMQLIPGTYGDLVRDYEGLVKRYRTTAF